MHGSLVVMVDADLAQGLLWTKKSVFHFWLARDHWLERCPSLCCLLLSLVDRWDRVCALMVPLPSVWTCSVLNEVYAEAIWMV